MDIEQGTEAATQDLTNNESESDSQTQEQNSAVIDLSKAEKFLLDGKEMTLKELQQERMRHKDYTQKTQSLAEERKYQKYYSNLTADLKAVQGDPNLIAQFKAIYPKDFHSYLDLMGLKEQENPQNDQGKFNVPADILNKLERLEQYVNEKEVSSIQTQIDSEFTKLSQKYPHGDEDLVLAKAQVMVDSGAKATPEFWEKLWRDSHDRFLEKLKSHKNGQFDRQRDANKRAKEPAGGGGIPTRAPKRESMKEATERAIKELSGR